MNMNSKVDIQKLIDQNTIKNFGLKDNGNYFIDMVDARNLLVAKRIDLVAKYMYVLFNCRGIKSTIAEDIYKKHIEIFSDGKFYEPGSDSKITYEDFLSEYKELYDDISKNGFDPSKSLVPINSEGVILNGAHRTAIAMYLGKEINVLNIGETKELNYNYQYFEKGCMPRNYLDFLALNYIKLSPKLMFAICFWPKAVSKGKNKQCEELIAKNASIVYKKRLPLSKIGLKNLMMHLYSSENWVGSGKNNYVGAYGKADPCYSKADTVVYFVEGDSLEKMLSLKEKIRSIYNIGKHSVHITDNNKETLVAANLLLTSNSLSALNFGCQDKINKKLSAINQEEDKKECSILNPLYTLMYYGYNVTVDDGRDFIDNDSLDKDVIYDNNNYFYYRGFRFFSPEYAMEMCGEKYKKMFNAIITMNKTPLKTRLKEKSAKTTYRTKRKMKNALRKAGLLKYAQGIKKKVTRK